VQVLRTSFRTGLGSALLASLLLAGVSFSRAVGQEEPPRIRFSVDRIELVDDTSGGPLRIGCKVTRSVALTSQHNRSLKVDLRVRNAQIGPGFLHVLNPRGQFDLLDEQSLTVRFAFVTQKHGPQSMFIDAFVGGELRPTATLEVFANPDPAQVEAPDEVDFGFVNPGSAAVRQRLTLRLPEAPAGQGPCRLRLRVEGPAGDANFALEGVPDDGFVTLAPGPAQRVTLLVVFRVPEPFDRAEKQAVVTLSGDGLDAPRQVLLKGRLLVDPISFDPPAQLFFSQYELSFARTRVGAESTRTLVVRNNTNKPLTVIVRYQLGVQPPPSVEAPFFGLPANESSFELPARGTRSFDVVFRPPGPRGLGYRLESGWYAGPGAITFTPLTFFGEGFVETGPVRQRGQ